MINEAKIDFQLVGNADIETLGGGKYPETDPYQQLLTTIAALKNHHEGFSIIIQVVDSPLLIPRHLNGALECMVASLTRREVEVYNLAVKGFSNRRIAERLFISLETVKSHRKSIVAKIGVKNIEEIKNRILEVNKLI